RHRGLSRHAGARTCTGHRAARRLERARPVGRGVEAPMAQEALGRIEKAIASLAAEVAGLREQVDALRGGDGALTPREIQDFLDQYRAAEALGEAAFGAWIATSSVACLRGGLRNAQLREGSHARLLEARLKELGGSPRCELPESVSEGFF